MSSGRRIAPVAILLIPLFLVGTAHAATPRTLIATVERVSDGDTVIAITENQTKLRIGLLGIDAPEIAHGKKPGQPFGVEGRDHLDRLIGVKTVRVDAYGPDRYHRVLAVIWDGPVNVNLEMVRAGLAEVYRGDRCQAYCEDLLRAEAEARHRWLRMWAQGDKYESPAVFRKRMRMQGG